MVSQYVESSISQSPWAVITLHAASSLHCDYSITGSCVRLSALCWTHGSLIATQQAHPPVRPSFRPFVRPPGTGLDRTVGPCRTESLDRRQFRADLPGAVPVMLRHTHCCRPSASICRPLTVLIYRPHICMTNSLTGYL